MLRYDCRSFLALIKRVKMDQICLKIDPRSDSGGCS